MTARAWMSVVAAGMVFQSLAGSAPVAAQSGGMIVAVVDIKKVFDQYQPFQAKMEQLRQERKTLQEQNVAKRRNLANRIKQLQQLKPTSQEYKQLEAELAREESSIATSAKLVHADLLRREAREHYYAYQQVIAAIARVCQKHNISLVLHYDSAPIDPANPTSILKGINRVVVYQQRLDITGLVLQELNQVAQAPQGVPRR